MYCNMRTMSELRVCLTVQYVVQEEILLPQEYLQFIFKVVLLVITYSTILTSTKTLAMAVSFASPAHF